MHSWVLADKTNICSSPDLLPVAHKSEVWNLSSGDFQMETTQIILELLLQDADGCCLLAKMNDWFLWIIWTKLNQKFNIDTLTIDAYSFSLD
jgi:hypothetical protein